MSHSTNQFQHRVPQVYLKQFGYEEGGIWYVSAFDKLTGESERKDVRRFMGDINIFDYDIIPEIELRRSFELLCQRVEVEYKRIINTIAHQKRLTDRHKHILCDFITSLYIRSSTVRSFYRGFLIQRDVRDKFIEEITMFQEEYRDYFDIVFWSGLHLEEQLKVVIGVLGTHLSKVIRSFKTVLLRSPSEGGRFWPTSDNPVIFDKQGNYSYIVPWETELYLPLSKEFCLYMYHEASEINSNPLRTFKTTGINQCDLISHGYICMKVAQNAQRHLIMPGRFEYKPHEIKTLL